MNRSTRFRSGALAALPLLLALPAFAPSGNPAFDQAPARVVGAAVPGGLRVAVTIPSANKVVLLDQTGRTLKEFDPIPEPVGLGAGGGRVYVGSSAHGSVQVFDLQARPQGVLGAGNGEFERPTDIAVSPVDGRVFVVDAGRAEIRGFDPATGQEVARIGDGVLSQPSAVAIAADGTIFTGDLVRGVVDRFDAAGNHLGSFTTFGSNPGQTVRPTGIAFDARGRVYVVDTYLDQVDVYQADGTFITTLGAFGNGQGLMMNPLDVWVSPTNGAVLVTDLGDWELEVFPAVP
ncbi:MAG: hypothetical protein D6702_00865 [Planctomycetota bacterium]|nr:MAG: hypothetical protein D6702_00865 [Planctomycetota bacterium]